MFEQLITFDQKLTLALSNSMPHTPFFDLIFNFFSLSGLTVIIWIVILVCFFIWEENKHKEFLLYFSASFLSSAFLVNIVLKNIFMRLRPWVEFHINTSFCPTDFSFPSGHAASAFVGAVIFSYFDKKRWPIYYGVAILISYSRIYLSCHYLLDVIVGASVGLLISKATIYILSKKLYRNIL